MNLETECTTAETAAAVNADSQQLSEQIISVQITSERKMTYMAPPSLSSCYVRAPMFPPTPTLYKRRHKTPTVFTATDVCFCDCPSHVSRSGFPPPQSVRSARLLNV